jgi:peroxiredoxin Q/BCP
MIKVGDKVPYFTAKDSNGIEFNIQDYIGNKALIIFFYPKDDTPGCTKQACEFRNQYNQFKNRETEIIGISGDDDSDHRDFSIKYQLPYTLLSDSDKKIRNLFGVQSRFFGLLPNRITFVVNKNGIVIMRYENNFNPLSHIKKSLETINNE